MLNKPLIIAGHICLDMIPTLADAQQPLGDLLVPGGMLKTGPMTVATGGVVPNTGLALHRLGVPVRLLGKVADDAFGQAILDVLRGYAPALADGMLVTPGAHSAYTVILSSSGVDRAFLHYTGPNDTFCSADVPDEQLAGACLFHFGYPPVMRRMYMDDGRELVALFQRVRAHGLVTSLDMTRPAPDSEAGRINWRAWLAQVLPYTDVFLPSLAEIFFMLDRPHFEALEKQAGAVSVLSLVDGNILDSLSRQLLAMGVAIAGIKVGDQGMYLRTTSDKRRLQALSDRIPLDVAAWTQRELHAPPFRATLVGTTGAGDCAIAGFLAGLTHGQSPEDTLRSAVGVGACNIEAADAISGVPTWNVVQARIVAGWEHLPIALKLRGWGWDQQQRLWIGPHNQGGQLC